jgi:hypothetical protein
VTVLLVGPFHLLGQCPPVIVGDVLDRSDNEIVILRIHNLVGQIPDFGYQFEPVV